MGQAGLPVDPEIAQAVRHAAQLMEHAGALVEPMMPFMTPTMLDGLDALGIGVITTPEVLQLPGEVKQVLDQLAS